MNAVRCLCAALLLALLVATPAARAQETHRSAPGHHAHDEHEEHDEDGPAAPWEKAPLLGTLRGDTVALACGLIGSGAYTWRVRRRHAARKAER